MHSDTVDMINKSLFQPLWFLSCSLSAVVTIELLEAQYNVGEQDGAVIVCATLRGETEGMLQVTLSTLSNTAIG